MASVLIAVIYLAFVEYGTAGRAAGRGVAIDSGQLGVCLCLGRASLRF